MATQYQSIPREYPSDCTCTVAFGHGVTHAPYCQYVRNLYQQDNPTRKDGTRTPQAKAKSSARKHRKRALSKALASLRGAIIITGSSRY